MVRQKLNYQFNRKESLGACSEVNCLLVLSFFSVSCRVTHTIFILILHRSERREFKPGDLISDRAWEPPFPPIKGEHSNSPLSRGETGGCYVIQLGFGTRKRDHRFQGFTHRSHWYPAALLRGSSFHLQFKIWQIICNQPRKILK